MDHLELGRLQHPPESRNLHGNGQRRRPAGADYQNGDIHLLRLLGLVEQPAPQLCADSELGSLPNDLTSSAGVGDGHWITPNQTIGYQLQFANAKPGNPDQTVTINQTLDPNLDPTTFAFGDIRLGSTVVQVPAGLQTFSTVINIVTASGTSLQVSINATLTSGTASWTFQAIDPATGLAPTDPTVGFLSYLDNGEVDWSVRPKAGLASGTRIGAGASIDFSTQSNSYFVQTPTPSNSIDADPPTSSVTALPTFSGPSFTVSWSGNDGPALASLPTTSTSPTTTARSRSGSRPRPRPPHPGPGPSATPTDSIAWPPT